MKDNKRNSPYATHGYTVEAPKQKKDEPKSSVRLGNDLRTRGNKK